MRLLRKHVLIVSGVAVFVVLSGRQSWDRDRLTLSRRRLAWDWDTPPFLK